MLIFPAIDILGGRCVRLSQGDYGQVKQYGEDPAEMAASFADAGAEWIHVVDLDAAKSGEPVNFAVLARLARTVRLPVQIGGGVRTLEYAERLLGAGFARVIVGTKLVQNLELAKTLFQVLGDRVVAGIDSKSGMVAVHGWTETSTLNAVEFAQKLQSLGCQRVIATDVATDGMLLGPNLELMKSYVASLSIPVIASGGVASLEDIFALKALGTEGAIVGKAIYEGRFSVGEALVAAC